MGYRFPPRFLRALGAWQNGWLEDPRRREAVTKELLLAIAESHLPSSAKHVDHICYRKRFLVTHNPQNNGDFVGLFTKGIDDGVASWTANKKFAQDFKGPIRQNAIAAVFGHKPAETEVVLNIPALWTCAEFKEADLYTGDYADALHNFKSQQSEIILKAPLLREDLVGLCGKSSPFDDLCEMMGVTDEKIKNDIWRTLVERDIFPEGTWITGDAVQFILERTIKHFNALTKKAQVI